VFLEKGSIWKGDSFVIDNKLHHHFHNHLLYTVNFK